MLRNLTNRIVRCFVDLFIAYCEKFNKIEHIKGHGTTETYLLRYQLVKSRIFNCYIHRVLRSDHDVPHDHPWDFFTYMVDGSYSEHCFTRDPETNDLICKVTKRPKGTWATREAHEIHKLVIDRTYTVAEKELAPLTLFITGPHKRTWGFWPGEKCSKQVGSYLQTQFTEWKKYLKINEKKSEKA